MILWILFAWLFVGGVLTLEARTSKEAVAEAESYPAVKRVIVWEEIADDA